MEIQGAVDPVKFEKRAEGEDEEEEETRGPIFCWNIGDRVYCKGFHKTSGSQPF